MFIQTEITPNPATLKFLPGRAVMTSGTAHFETEEAARRSPLATALFDIDGVEGVFLGSDFISITKDDETEWQTLRPMLLGRIMDHFTAGGAVLSDEADAEDESFAPEDADIVAQIKELIETRVRPAVAQDGGDIVFRAFEKGVVSLHLQGSCAGCPSSTATLKMGIENMLKHYVPEVVSVRAVG